MSEIDVHENDGQILWIGHRRIKPEKKQRTEGEDGAYGGKHPLHADQGAASTWNSKPATNDIQN
jgi:hypothetical protein